MTATAQRNRGRHLVRHPVAWKPLSVVAVVLVVVLFLTSRRYGYHRDELFLLASGDHLAWGYPDQGPLTPLVAKFMTLFGDSLMLLRLPSALMVGVVCVLTGVMAARVGANVLAQVTAGLAVALSGFTLVIGHQLTTMSLSMLLWTVALMIFLIIVQDGEERLWPWFGVVVGIELENRALVLGLVAALVIGVVVAGPPGVLSRRALTAAGIALVLWLPNLIWQSMNGWPLFRATRGVSDGLAAASTERWAVIPMQVVLTGIVVFPVVVVGLWVLWRNKQLRFLTIAYLTFLVAVIAAGGKAYYLAGFYPIFVAAGMGPSLRWLIDRATTLQRGIIEALAVVTVALTAVVALPLLPAKTYGDIGFVELNPDAGETLGWPELVRTVGSVYNAVPVDQRETTAVLAGNYGEAGAIDRYGPDYGVPHAFSPHMGYWNWGHPKDTVNQVVAVGYTEKTLLTFFVACQPHATINNGADVQNVEQGGTVFLCQTPLVSWPALWPMMQSYS